MCWYYNRSWVQFCAYLCADLSRGCSSIAAGRRAQLLLPPPTTNKQTTCCPSTSPAMTRKKRIPDAPFLHDVHEFEAQCTQASAAVLVTLKALAEKHKQMRVWDHLSARVRKVVAMSKYIWGRAAPSMNALAESRWELGAEALWDTLGDALFSPDFVRLLAYFAHHADATTWPDAHQALVAAADARRANKSRRERISVTRAWVPSDVKDAMVALGVPLPTAAAPKTKAKATARTSAPPPSQSPSPPPSQSPLSRKREAPAPPSRLAPIAEEASPRTIEDGSPTNSRLTPIPEKAPPDTAEDPSPTVSRLTPIREEASSGTAGDPSPEIEQARKSELANLSDFDQDFDKDFDFLSAPSSSHSPPPSLSPTLSPPPVPTPHFPTPLHSTPSKRRPDDADPPCSPQRSPKRVCARADMPNNDTVVVTTGRQTEQEERLYMALQQLQEDQWLRHAAIFETLALLTPPNMHLEETTLDDELPAEQLQRWATTARKPLGPDVGQVLCPLHRSRRRHWLLLHFHLAGHRVTLHDSMKLDAAAYVSELAASKALVQRFGQDWDAGGWKFELSLTTPQQDGFNDCGIFTIITCLQYIGRVRPIDQVDGSLWRTAFRCLLASLLHKLYRLPPVSSFMLWARCRSILSKELGCHHELCCCYCCAALAKRPPQVRCPASSPPLIRHAEDKP